MSTIEQEVEAEHVPPAASQVYVDLKKVVRRGRRWAARKIDPR